MVATQQAIRVDRQTGIREVAEFLGPGRIGMFGFTHLPPAEAQACVVICSPLYAEFARNYRREVLVGRRLAAAGVAVQRFHYRGHGNSEGELKDTTFESMRDDAIAAAHHLVEATGITRVAFFGTRLGALVAAAAANGFGSAPLALWDPVLDPSQYLQDIFRARRIQALKEGSEGSEPSAGMTETLEREGAVQILGYTVTRSLYESTRDRSLKGEVGSSPRPIYVIQLGRDPRIHRGVEELVTEWEAADFEVLNQTIGKQEPWWFTSGPFVIGEALTQPVDLTVDWLTRTLRVRAEG